MLSARDSRTAEALLQAAENPDAKPFVLRRFGPEQAALEAPHLAPLIRLWAERRGQQGVPDWSEMDFADFRGWHAAMVVSDLPPDEPDPQFRIVGEDLRIVDYTTDPGQRFSDRTPRLYARQFREHFRQIRETGLIGWSVGPVAFLGREHRRVKVLELPFRNGGPAVSRLVHVMTCEFVGEAG